MLMLSAFRGAEGDLPFHKMACFLWVLPTLIDELETVTIRVKYVGRIVARIVIQPDTGRAIIGSSSRDGGGIGGFNLLPTAGDKTDMHSTAVGRAFPKPQI